MRQSKLLLPWPTKDRPDGTLIDSVLNAWTSSCVTTIVIVVRADDEQLAAACAKWRVTLLRPDAPPADMKASVQLGVEFINKEYRPNATSRCFVAPADLPTLTHHLIDRLAATDYDSDRIVVPLFGSRQGHPALLPWVIMPEIFSLADDEGIDQLVNRHPGTTVAFPAADRIDDIDTPDEYENALLAARKLP